MRRSMNGCSRREPEDMTIESRATTARLLSVRDIRYRARAAAGRSRSCVAKRRFRPDLRVNHSGERPRSSRR